VQKIAPIEYFIYGLAWSGFMLAQTKLLLKMSPNNSSNECAAYFSIYATVSGISGAIFTFLGGQLVQQLSESGGFKILWILGFVTRIAILWVFCKPLLEMNKMRLKTV
jgi:MFS family permease